MFGCGGRKGRCGKRYERRCRKVCWVVGEVRVDIRKGEVREMWGSVLGPHTLTHFTTPPPFLSPHPSPSRQHTSPFTAYTFPHFSTPHTSFLTHPHTPTHFLTSPPTHLFPQLPSFPTTPQNTSPLTPCTLPHLSAHLPPQFGLCGEVTM